MILLLLTRLLRVLVVLFVLRLVLRFVAGMLRPRPQKPGRTTSADLELVRDQVCNTFLPRARAVTAQIAGREEHFCSPACRDRALAQIARA